MLTFSPCIFFCLVNDIPGTVATELISKLNFLEDEDQDTPSAMSTNPFEEPEDDPQEPNHLNPFGDPDDEGMYQPPLLS